MPTWHIIIGNSEINLRKHELDICLCPHSTQQNSGRQEHIVGIQSWLRNDPPFELSRNRHSVTLDTGDRTIRPVYEVTRRSYTRKTKPGNCG